MSNESVNYWKLATIAIVLVGATVAGTLLVTGRDSKTEAPESAIAQVELTPVPSSATEAGEKAVPAKAAEAVAPAGRQRSDRVTQPSRNTSVTMPPPPYPAQAAAYPPHPAYPPQSVMEVCNKYAHEQVSSKTQEVLTSAALGAAIGAAVGAAGGAIAGGGSGAGKGAAIGGVTGAAGGTLYGLNETKEHDAEYNAVYSSCMRSKGY